MKNCKNQINFLYAAASVFGASMVTGCCCPPPAPVHHHCTDVCRQPVYVRPVEQQTTTEYYIFMEEVSVIEKYKRKGKPCWSRLNCIE